MIQAYIDVVEENKKQQGVIFGNMSYKELKGICKVAIEKGWCLGCNRLELESFEGVRECIYIPSRENRK